MNSVVSKALIALAIVGTGGCTAESLHLALEAQQRADEVEQAIFERQNQALRILLYRNLVARLEQTGQELSKQQHAVLNEVWNDRDLVEFWAVQHERVRALRLAGVNAKLASDQAIVDLLVKNAQARLQRAGQQAASQIAEQVVGSAGK